MPGVSVVVKQINSQKVFVTGEVAHPGAFDLQPRAKLLQVIALAGGLPGVGSVIRKRRRGAVVERGRLIGQCRGRVRGRHRRLRHGVGLGLEEAAFAQGGGG